MNIKTIIRFLIHLSSFFIFVIVWAILHFTFKNLGSDYKGMISAGIAYLISPRVSKQEAPSGKKLKLKWIFSKKTLFV